MAKVSSSALLGNLQSQSTKTLGFIRQSDLRTDNNVKKASLMNVSLDSTENDVLAEESKISSVSLMGEGEVAAGPQENVRTSYLQGFSDAMTSLTKQLKKGQEGEQPSQPQQPPGGGPGDLATTTLAGGALAAGGFAALSGTTGASQGSKPTSVPYSPFKGSTGRPVITSGYGTRNGRMHKGYDIEADPGTPVYAYFPGVVIENNYDPGGWGNYVKWKDNVYGQTHLYGHLQSRSPIPVGQKFDQGALLGRVGSTGRSTGPHLHWEIGNGNTNPAEWVRTHPMKTKETEAAKVKPEAAKPAAAVTQTQLQPPPKQQAAVPVQTIPSPTTSQNVGRISSGTSPTYNIASNNSLTESAAFLQALS